MFKAYASNLALVFKSASAPSRRPARASAREAVVSVRPGAGCPTRAAAISGDAAGCLPQPARECPIFARLGVAAPGCDHVDFLHFGISRNFGDGFDQGIAKELREGRIVKGRHVALPIITQ